MNTVIRSCKLDYSDIDGAAHSSNRITPIYILFNNTISICSIKILLLK